VTVVIPAWGGYVDFVPSAVASAGSRAVSTRVLVVDNAGDPPIAAIDAAEVVRSDVRLTRGAARNLGLSHVLSEYVVFLDADDLLLPGALDSMFAGIELAPGSPALVGRIVDSTGVPHRAPRRLAVTLARHRRLFAWCNAAWSLMPTQGCTIMRTEVVREAGGYGDASLGEDWMLAVRLAFRGPIVFDPAPALIYRSRADSPGAARGSRRVLLRNAAHVRDRLREDSTPGAAIALLAIVQALAVLVAHPLATAFRRRARRATT
jgi:glycosyltransferase involved in cell wall biosynthesis